MPESGSEMSLIVPPEHIGAVFQQGRYGPVREVYWKDLVNSYDVTKPSERRAWCLDNVKAFSSTAELPWKAVEDQWLADLKLATLKANFPGTPQEVRAAREEVKETEKLLKAMMAVSGSARAMEASGGSAAKYVAVLTQNPQGDLDRADSWADFLLHNDPGKINYLLGLDKEGKELPLEQKNSVQELIEHYYQKLLDDAGIDKVTEWNDKKPRTLTINNPRQARNGKLVQYLKSSGQQGGLSGYMSSLLEEDSEAFRNLLLNKDQIGDTAREAAARLACDIFLVDKYTEWEYMITGAGREEKTVYGEGNDLRLTPSKDWGGDPLRAVLEPSFLPKVIKKVYSDKERAILQLTDESFRPTDVFGLPGHPTSLSNDVLPTSMAVHLKNYARYNEALWTFLGGSRAGGIPVWSEEVVHKNLPSISELLDQVYGGITKDRKDGFPTNKFPIGKHIVGAMMSRILHAKALAVTIETDKPNWRDYMNVIFGTERGSGRPFFKVEQMLWGENLDSTDGFVKQMASGRTKLVFRENLFNAEKYLNESWQLLSTNDQDPGSGKKMVAANRLGFILEVLQEAQKIWIRGR